MTEFSGEKLRQRYLRIKQDSTFLLIDDLGRMIKKFIDTGRDHIRISVCDESSSKGIRCRYYIDGVSHPIIDLLGICVISNEEDNVKFHLTPEQIKTHTLCVSNSGKHLVVLRCTCCSRYQNDHLEKIPCKKPLIQYLKEELKIEITAKEVLKSRDYIDHSLLQVDVMLSWKHWIDF